MIASSVASLGSYIAGEPITSQWEVSSLEYVVWWSDDDGRDYRVLEAAYGVQRYALGSILTASRSPIQQQRGGHR